MFGTSTSPPKDNQTDGAALLRPSSSDGPGSIPGGLTLQTPDEANTSGEKRNMVGVVSSGRKSADDASPSGEKKRRSSGVAKASALFSSAKNSFHLSGSSHSNTGDSSQAQTPMQKLGKTDPALSVPQGSLNNSAGESHPGPRSTFRVGVTEDKNKKCRRTMEDTHAYLYNFLSTPAPAIGSELTPITSKKSLGDSSTTESDTSAGQTPHVVETDNGYFAIFDGHAGTFAADWCGKKLHLLLEETIRKNPNSPIPELLDQTFTNVDLQLEKLPLKNSGCTAIIAVLRWEDRIPNPQSATGSSAIATATAAAVKAASDPSANAITDPPSPHGGAQNNPTSTGLKATTALPKLQEVASRQRVLYTANVGDARIVLCRNGKALRLSYDHKGSDENEGKRVSNAGGLILNNRVNGVLAVTRALGDAYMKDLVTGHPYTTETVIQPDIDEFLILACDGLWDVCTDQEAVDLIRHTSDPQLASKQLVEHALARFSTDNLSCMVVRFDNKALVHAVEHGADPIGVEGDPPSREAGGISEAEAIVREARRSVVGAGAGVEGENGGGGATLGAALEAGNAGNGNGNGNAGKLSREIIKEEEEKEPGPELRPEADMDLTGPSLEVRS